MCQINRDSCSNELPCKMCRKRYGDEKAKEVCVPGVSPEKKKKGASIGACYAWSSVSNPRN